jgi:tight adherence protein C
MQVYLSALAVALGLAGCTALVLIRRDGSATVAHSLSLIAPDPDAREAAARNELPAGERLVQPVFDLGRRISRALTPAGTNDKLVKLLDFAGNPRDWGADRVLALKGVCLLVGAALGLLFGHVTLLGVVCTIAGGAFGFFLPNLLLYNMGLHRQDELRLGLADALDMLTVCVQAGQSFDAALQNVAQNVEGPVAGEFSRIIQEISIGRSRAEAFSSMAERTTVPEIKTFITAMVQADRLGLGIGGVLHEQAGQMRLVRRQRAEEMAQKVPVKIMVPMVLCVFPLLFVVLIGPGGIQIADLFTHFHAGN